MPFVTGCQTGYDEPYHHNHLQHYLSMHCQKQIYTVRKTEGGRGTLKPESFVIKTPIDRIRAIIRICPLIRHTQTNNTLNW